MQKQPGADGRRKRRFQLSVQRLDWSLPLSRYRIAIGQ
jgi:hypothetical protein